MNILRSKNDVPIRLTDERWVHITEEHSELAGYYFEVLEAVEDPEVIYEGRSGECIAVRQIKEDKYIAVIYRELGEKDGFIITAFLTRRKRQLERRRAIWRHPK